MRTKNRRLIGVLTLLTAMLFVLGTGIYFVNAENEPVYKIQTLQSEYEYGGTLTLADSFVEVGENAYPLDTTVVYPDGRTTGYNKLSLDCVGEYTVKYHTVQSGVSYANEQKFTVKRTMANQFVNVEDCEINYNVDGPDNTGYWTSGVYESVSYNGVSVKSTSSDSHLKYNGIVNLAELQREKPFLQFLFTPDTQGTIEVNEVTIRLTDIYDENNFITIRLESMALYGPYEGSSCVYFCANDMYKPTGHKESDYYVWDCENCLTRTAYNAANTEELGPALGENGTQETDSNGRPLLAFRYTCPECSFVAEVKKHNNEIFKNLFYGHYDENGDYNGSWQEEHLGTPINFSFYGKSSENANYLALPLYFDTLNQEVWSELIMPKVKGPFRQWKAFDFQNSDIIGSNIWEGFATGEVYMDIFIESTSKGGTILITQANGLSMSGDSYVKDGKPSVSIDYGDYTESTMPNGLAGENCYYEIPDVFAYSTNCGVIKDVNTIVWYMDGAEQKRIPVINGKFPTKEVGEYIIHFAATDENGNTTNKMLSINVNASYESELSYSFSDRIAETYALGVERIYLYEGVSVGGEGKLTVESYVTKNGEKVEIAYDGTLGYFVPTEAGEYELVCAVTDYIGTEKIFTKTITVTGDGTPVFGEFYLPTAIRAGYEYRLPQVSAKCGDADAPVTITVNGETVTNGVYTPAQAGTITVVYTATNPSDSSKSVSVTKEIQVLAVNDDAYATSYLVAEGMSYDSASLTAISYEVTDNQNASLFFANSLISSSSITFSFKAKKANVEKVRITFIDARTGVEYAVDVVNTNGFPVVWHNGNRLGEMYGRFGTETANVMGLSYRGGGLLADYENTTMGYLTHSVDGREFVEFGAEIYVKIEVIGAQSGTIFELRNINGQVFNDDLDWAAPTIYFEENFPSKTVTECNSTVTVPKAQAFDVFGSVVNLSVTVTAPDQTIVYQGPIDTEYEFTVTQLGTYRVTYFVEDDSGNSEEPMTLNFVVLDTTAPEIGEVGLEKVVYKVGESFTVPAFEATDEFDANVTKYVLVCDYEDMYRIVEGSYTFTNVGKYRIRFVAADSSLNMTYKEIVVYVVEGE